MALIVQKFGGSSVTDVTAIRRVAERVVQTHRAGHDVAVVVSAMGDTTDDLLDLANEVCQGPHQRELDMLLTAGERISMALLAMAIQDLDVPARSFTGEQAGLYTDSSHGHARLVGVAPRRVKHTLGRREVAIIAGFQGISPEEDVTTLGRGGSDTTAVALAAGLKADVCEIYTDVDGLFTADPRIVPSARRIHKITIEETLEMAAHGAKILHLRAVEYARRFSVPLHVRSSFSDRDGTWILVDDRAHPFAAAHLPPDSQEGSPDSEDVMENPIISGIAHDRGQGKITVLAVPDHPGSAASLFEVVAASGANIDMIVQNMSTHQSGVTDISFTLPEESGPTAVDALCAAQEQMGFAEVIYADHVGILSLVGAGMRSNPGVSAKFFGALSEAGINIGMISTSEIRISVVTDLEDLDSAVRAVHTAFDLDAAEVEAVVYGGTGR